MTDILVDSHLNPDCESGKHGRPDHGAWCMDRDEPVDCECVCHEDAEVVAA